MSKLYYTNDHVSSLANEWHGVNFIDDDGKVINNTLDLQLHLLDKELSKPYKIYIHPDSIDIFKPMVGDLITNIGNSGWLVNGFETHGDIDHLVHHTANGKMFTRVNEAIIIQRNGKSFFNPEVSDE